MLSFAYLAYTGEGITTPNPEPQIKASIAAALPKISLSSTGADLSDWTLVWGPVSYTVPGSKYQDNLLFVAQKTGTSQYVIATRGTNFASQVDWFLEDFEIVETMPWPMPSATSKAASGAAISESTSIGMTIQISESMMVDDGVSLLNFLKNITKNGAIDVCVTGHSLGGVLANTLALYMLENPTLWDSSANAQSTVCCISFAAPTGGNALYASNALSVFQAAVSKGTFPGWDASIGSCLDNVCCNMDAAPLVWTASNLYSDGAAGSVFSIYASPTNPSDNIDFANLKGLGSEEWNLFQSMVLGAVSGLTEAHDYTQLVTTDSFPGNFIGNSLSFESLSSLQFYLGAFAAQAVWQHSNSYPLYLQVPDLFDPTIIVRNDGASSALPTITSISPTSAMRILPTGVQLTVTGTGFSTSAFSNFLVFTSTSAGTIPYRMISATETEIVVQLYVKSASNGDGTYSFQVVCTSPYYTSNVVDFKVD